MKKIELLRAILTQLLTKPMSIRRIVDLTEYYGKYIKKKYDIECLPTIDIRTLFPDFNIKIEKYTYLEGTSLPIDIATVTRFAKGFNACNYFEIGCWRGESLFNVSKVAEKCTSLSLSTSEMATMGFPKGVIDQNHYFTKQLQNVAYFEHNSRTFDFSKLKDKFDLIFVDGDHHYDGVFSDSKNVVNLRKNKDSVIVWHDYAFTPERPRPEVLAGILDGVPKEFHKNLYHVSNTLCAVLIMKDFQGTQKAIFPTYPDKTFDIQMEVKDFKR